MVNNIFQNKSKKVQFLWLTLLFLLMYPNIKENRQLCESSGLKFTSNSKFCLNEKKIRRLIVILAI